MEHAGPAIRYRLATDVFPDLLSPEALDELQAEIEASAHVRQVVKKQKDTGVWAGNLLGVSPNKPAGIKDVGTIPQFRHLIEHGLAQNFRSLRLGSRLLFRLLSRDPDPKLLFEYEKYAVAEIGAEPWIRQILREAAAAALAHAGYGDDPRVRGAAHKSANALSAFLRSDVAAEPLVKAGRKWVLHPGAQPPNIFSVSLLAWLPAVQRERAGLLERLGGYLAEPEPKRVYGIQAGRKSIKPVFLLLGDPLQAPASGQIKDLPFALYWLEVLARLGIIEKAPSAARVWARLVKDCDRAGVWHPRNLRSMPKATTPWSYHAFPLEADTKKHEAKQTDVTFRMALIARLAGWDVTAT